MKENILFYFERNWIAEKSYQKQIIESILSRSLAAVFHTTIYKYTHEFNCTKTTLLSRGPTFHHIPNRFITSKSISVSVISMAISSQLDNSIAYHLCNILDNILPSNQSSILHPQT